MSTATTPPAELHGRATRALAALDGAPVTTNQLAALAGITNGAARLILAEQAAAGRLEPGNPPPGRYAPDHRPYIPAGSWHRVLVTGSRTWTDTRAVTDALDALLTEHPARLAVVHGACPRGADAITDAWCRRISVRTERHPADWTTGRGAGKARNAAMVATRPNLCLAFILDDSPGATHCAALADRAGIPTTRHVAQTTKPSADAGASGRGGGEPPLAQHVDNRAAVAVDQGVGLPHQVHVVQAPVADEPVVIPQRDACLLSHAADSSGRPAAGRNGLLAAALECAAAGRPVFVLGRSKRPVRNCPACRTADRGHDPAACGCLTCHGFYAATTDPDRIRAMVDAVAGGLLALRTGAAAGLVVVDIDPGHGGRVDQALMPPTATVATGGGGWHLYYAHPGQPVPSRPLPGRPGVDIKADGGYVVLPPSIHPGTRRAYRTVGDRPVVGMPPALLAACLAEPSRQARADASHPPAGTTDHPAQPARPGHRLGAGGITSPPALLAALCDTVRHAPEGRRRVTLYGSARGVARMVIAGTITAEHGQAALTAAGRAAQQTDREILAAITGGFTAEGLAA